MNQTIATHLKSNTKQTIQTKGPQQMH